MKTIIACLFLLVGCGADEPVETSSSAAYSSCPLVVGDSVQFSECGGTTLGGFRCVTGCIHEPGDQSALPNNCTLPIYSFARNADETGVCVANCGSCQ